MKVFRQNKLAAVLVLLGSMLAFTLSISIAAQPNKDSLSNDSLSIEQAKSAIEEAKSALENAQNTLNKAQTAQNAKELAAKQPKVTLAQNSKLYKWVDDNGNISYQDSPPPKNSKVINADVLKGQQRGSQKVRELRRASDPRPALDGSTPVMVYTADNCKPCQSVVLFLTHKQVPFIERDIREDRRARERLSKLSKQISVPSLFIGEEIVQGHSKPEITSALKKAGYLKQ